MNGTGIAHRLVAALGLARRRGFGGVEDQLWQAADRAKAIAGLDGLVAAAAVQLHTSSLSQNRGGRFLERLEQEDDVAGKKSATALTRLSLGVPRHGGGSRRDGEARTDRRCKNIRARSSRDNARGSEGSEAEEYRRLGSAKDAHRLSRTYDSERSSKNLLAEMN